MLNRIKRFKAARLAGAGARWLDRTKPNWHTRVNLTKINMHASRWCVLGQVFHTEGSVLFGYSIAIRRYGLSYGWLVKHGFISDSGEPFYPYLTEAWKREVLVRRRRDGQVTIDRLRGTVDGWERQYENV